MKSHVRAAVAGLALCCARGTKISFVYSYAENMNINIEISINNNRVNGYDYTNNCQLDGTLPSLYHYGESSHIDFKEKSTYSYSGFDYGSSSHFEITVKGNSAEIYDYGESKYFSYST